MSLQRLAAAGLCAAALLALAPSSAAAQSEGVEKGEFGVGIIVGEPTGVAGKLYLDNDTAVAGALGSAVVSGGLHVHADYLYHPWILTDEEAFVLPAYVGPGVRLLADDRGRGNDSDFHIGIRGVAGIMFDFKRTPLDVFVEVAGVIDYVTSDDETRRGLDAGLNAGLGVRYYF